MKRFVFATPPSRQSRQFAEAVSAQDAVTELVALTGIGIEKRMTKAIPSLITSLLLLLFPIVVSAQTTSSTSSVTGVVTDFSGAVITGATVILTDTKTSKELTTTTDEQGVYRFAQVQPGQGYRLTFSGTGFQTFVITDVALGVGTSETHNAQLTAGQVTETVEITASNEATLNTTDASIGNVI
ncbi:MAG TPA: carboxypeptidase-like regulatory domain-containing protein, partial [Pyrinomonadaceae bacterium]|nr:carboxypeptidase-like regulatory domain-containing protein [Pyrinomonadaceae bacterium]